MVSPKSPHKRGDSLAYCVDDKESFTLRTLFTNYTKVEEKSRVRRFIRNRFFREFVFPLRVMFRSLTFLLIRRNGTSSK